MLERSLEKSLTLHQLRVFKSVIESGGITRAAEALSLSQPAVSHQVHALVRALGQPLFQPGRGPITLTPVGAALYERAGRILALVQETGEAIDELMGLRKGRVRVAGDTTVGTYVLPDALAVFHTERPGIELSLDVVNRQRVRQLLHAGDIDLGVVGRLWDDDSISAEPLLENELMCFSAPEHPLTRREPVELREMLDGPLLLRERGSGTRESTETLLREHAIEPVAAMEMASNGALKRAVAGGLGVTVLSTYAVRLEVSLGLLRPLNVRGFPVRRQWHVVRVADRVLSHAAESFHTFLNEGSWRKQLLIPLGTD
jgi:LysR family transcriptional regulator, low CO2-responsive transcriptional regulator